MRIVFLILIGLHGLIHVMGFVKAFQIAEIKELTQTVSKPAGLLWLLTFLLFSGAWIQYLIRNEYWWLTAFIAVLLSQLLIIIFWRDAKFGTIPNLIILLTAIVAFATFNFDRMVNREIDDLFSRITLPSPETITADELTRLPDPVQRWLTSAGIVGSERVYTVRLKQQLMMKMKPEQEDWMAASAEQVVMIDNPAFIWKVAMQMMPLVSITGRDKFVDGRGAMLIKILSLIPVADTGNNDKINSSSLQRYLGEIVWYPVAALSPYIRWEKIDDLSARATMTYQGTTGSGVFYFNENGEFKKFSTQRYLGTDDKATLKEWIIIVSESSRINGVVIPVKCQATWKLETGDWTWLKLEITDIKYN